MLAGLQEKTGSLTCCPATSYDFTLFPKPTVPELTRSLYSAEHGSRKCKWLTEFGDPNFSFAHRCLVEVFYKTLPRKDRAKKRCSGFFRESMNALQRCRGVAHTDDHRTSGGVARGRIPERDVLWPRKAIVQHPQAVRTPATGRARVHRGQVLGASAGRPHGLLVHYERTRGRRGQHHRLHHRLLDLDTTEGLACAKGVEHVLDRPETVRLEAGHYRDEHPAHRCKTRACLTESRRQRKPHTVLDRVRVPHRVEATYLGTLERLRERVLERTIRFAERRLEQECTSIVIEMYSRKSPWPEHEPDRRALVQVEIATNIAVPDAQEGRARERTEPLSLENPDPELERILTECAFVAGGRGRGNEARDVAPSSSVIHRLSLYPGR